MFSYVMESEISGFSTDEPANVSASEEPSGKYKFPISTLRSVVKDIFQEYNLPGIDHKIIERFLTLIGDEKIIYGETRYTKFKSHINIMEDKDKDDKLSVNSVYIDVKFTDQKIIDVVKNMIRKTSIPGPGDELYNDLYKVLVKNLSNELKQSNANDLDAEVTARKLAAWVMTLDGELKGIGQKNEEEEEPLPDNPYYYKPQSDGANHDKEDRNVKLYNLSEQHTQPYWQEPGEVVQLEDAEGSHIYVKGLDEGEGHKTLVKKVKTTDKGKEVSSWVVEVASKEQIKSLENTIKLHSDKPQKSKLRSPVTVDEWKTVADIRREEAKSWKHLSGSESFQENLSTSGHNSRPSVNNRLGANNYKSGRQRNNEARDTKVTLNKNLIDVAELRRGFKGFQKLNLAMNSTEEESQEYLMEELKKQSARMNRNRNGSRRVSSSAGNR